MQGIITKEKLVDCGEAILRHERPFSEHLTAVAPSSRTRDLEGVTVLTFPKDKGYEALATASHDLFLFCGQK